MRDYFDMFRMYREQLNDLVNAPAIAMRQMAEASAMDRVGVFAMQDAYLQAFGSQAMARMVENEQIRFGSALGDLLGDRLHEQLIGITEALRTSVIGIDHIESMREQLLGNLDQLKYVSRTLREHAFERASFPELIEEDQLEIAQGIESAKESADSGIELYAALLKWFSDLSPRLKPIVVHLLWPLLLGIFVNLVTPELQEWWVEKDGVASPRLAKKSVQKEVQEWYGPELLASRRIVVAPMLNVRARGSTKAEVLGAIPLGTVVRQLEKGRHWSRVEYFDPEGLVLRQGWVFSRYLSPLRM